MKILAIQNRMGIGDMVIFLPFIEAIAKKYETSVSILVKENSKASQFLKNIKYIDNIIILERNNKDGRHDGFLGSIHLINDLKKFNFEKVFIFNSSLRFNLISRLAGINKIYQYPLLKKKNQHIIYAAQDFLNSKLNLNVESNPEIKLDDLLVKNSKNKYNININQINILLGIGGSGPTKRIPAEKFIQFMEMIIKEYDCKFFLATGTKSEEQLILNQILKSEYNKKCVPLDKLNLNDILPIIKNCKIAICNDSSFSHLSAALGVPTIVLMSDTPLLYGSYSPRMYPIIPDGAETVGHDTLGKDKINPEKIYYKFKKILN
jgi:heptosyltransferase-2|tara:strand:- start:141 stop:1100 length:960 start_codon:yes stop_codon:yes gene_type:complete